jgi:hypothetical protein
MEAFLNIAVIIRNLLQGCNAGSGCPVTETG